MAKISSQRNATLKSVSSVVAKEMGREMMQLDFSSWSLKETVFWQAPRIKYSAQYQQNVRL